MSTFKMTSAAAVEAGKGPEIVFAFSSPYGILPLAMILHEAGRFVVDSVRPAQSRNVTRLKTEDSEVK